MAEENSKELIYVVDDEASVRLAVAESLLDCGYQTQTFASGEECLEKLKSMRCDLVVSDVNMPGIGGDGLLSSLTEHHPGIPLILITAFGNIPSAISSIQAGAAHYLEKPVAEAMLLQTVRQALSNARASVAEENKALEMLTKAEKTVLALITEGLTNREIAEKLERSTRTVESHRHRIHKKLGTKSTADLVRYSIQIATDKN